MRRKSCRQLVNKRVQEELSSAGNTRAQEELSSAGEHTSAGRGVVSRLTHERRKSCRQQVNTRVQEELSSAD